MPSSARKLHRISPAVAVLVLALCASLAQARAPSLVHDLVVRGDTSATTLVRLDQNLRWSPNRPAEDVTARVQGTGKLRGFMLRREGDGEEQPGILVYAGAIWPWPYSMLDWVAGFGDATVVNDQGGLEYQLPRGLYRLTLFTDAPGTTVRLVVPGLPAGLLELSGLSPVAAKVGELDVRDPTPLTNLAIRGSAGTLATRGMALVSVAGTAETTKPQRVETCFYPPGSDPTAPLAFGPLCPGGEATSTAGLFLFAADLQLRAAAAPGLWGIGGNVQNVGAPPPILGYGALVSWDIPLKEPVGTPVKAGAPTASRALPVGAGSVRGRAASVRLRCRGGTACSVRVRLAGGPTRTLRIPASATRTVTLRLPAHLRSKLRKHRRVRAVLELRTLPSRTYLRRRVVLRRARG